MAVLPLPTNDIVTSIVFATLVSWCHSSFVADHPEINLFLHMR